jgi:peptidoglycan/xylan/chitin deacetylase (PgdA/CDA1 family)
MIPHRTPFVLPWLYPSLTWRMPSEEKNIYLTFDDGPVHGPTEFALDELKKYSAKATFFCIGDNVHKHPEIFSKIIQGGHAVGNHTFNHLNGWKTASSIYLQNVKKCDDILNSHTTSTKLFRPPYGRITRNQIKLLEGYTIVMWDVLSVDYARSLSAERCLRNTIAATRDGSIVVFHDSYKAEKNMTHALPRYLEHFTSKGYSFKTLG